MIDFKKVTYRNFQSIGNQGITIDLQRSPTTLIGGHNGAGKSTMLEAIAYALFGKSLKKVNLAGLINTINKKNMVVEIEFSSKGKDYKIVRGQKPAKLEFYVGDELLDQNASSKDYQAKIEHALGMDFKLFTQVVVLNKEKYVPFMDLATSDRRKVIEDILDISVFSVMSDILKDDSKDLSNDINDLRYERDKLVERMRGQQRLIDEANQNVQGQVDVINAAIDQLNLDQAEVDNERQTLTDKIDTIHPMDTASINSRKRQFEELAVTFRNKVQGYETTLNFFKDNDVCPTCDQNIDQTIKHQRVMYSKTEIDKTKENATKMMVEYQKVVDQLALAVEQNSKVIDLQSQLNMVLAQANNIKRSIAVKQSELNALNVSSKVDQYKDELSATSAQHIDLTDKLTEAVESETVFTKCKELLKDTGIKASIVRDYIDLINLRLNEYLGAMDFYLNISLDEAFNDKINSINREGFTYESLSTGQKTRVNLALWIALLEVASLKNSVVTNILCLDEILENLDREGVASFMKLVKEKLPHKNVYVITQRFDEFEEQFFSSINFKLSNGFTEIA